MPLSITYPSTLPVSAHVDEIADAIRKHRVIIVSGDTGSGKTTQLPKICLQAGRGRDGLIAITQPRRLACSAMARRVAEELGEQIGGTVGYQHRFEKKCSDKTKIKFMTDGVLLAENAHDRNFRAYDTIIIDEAHERSLNIDFLLGLLRNILQKRKNLKVIVSSATLDVKRFSEFFSNAPIIEVPGRLFPIEMRWRPAEDDDADLSRQVANAVDEAIEHGPGDILVFLPGERDIRDAQEVIEGRRIAGLETIPLLASLPAGEQQRAFRTSSNRRVILATNVAETSLTIPGIRFVIDSGLARLNRWNPRTHVQRLQIEPISRASANQRAGRCGRIAPGVCIRLYAPEDFNRRDAFTPPEILRSSLAGVMLTMLNLKLGDIADFPFIDSPPLSAIRDAKAELEALGAINAGMLTPLGRKLARFPLEPAYARILFAAADEGVLEEALTVVASLECDDPRRRPIDKREEADALHARFLSPVSDFLGLLKLWSWYHEKTLSQTAARKLCKANYLSFPKMREWSDLREQLATYCKQLGIVNANRDGCTLPDAGLHRALLTGLFSNIGHKDPEADDYRGTRSIRFALFPGSGLFKKKLRPQQTQKTKPPLGSLPSSREWILAGELVDTSRLYARAAACIDPAWIEPAAKPICKYSWHSPEWDERNGFVRAKERVVLLGLLLSDGRLRDYSRINPDEARKIFIQHALVDGRFPAPLPPFLAANRKRIELLLEEEEKTRQHGFLFDPDAACAFYEKHLPPGICSARDLRKALVPQLAKELTMGKDDLPPVRDLSSDFPESVQISGNVLPLSYRHAPGEEDDGVTCTLPEELVSVAQRWRHDWLVPGFLDEKLNWMLASLPSKLRRLFVPLPDTIARLKGKLQPGSAPLFDAVSEALFSDSGVRVSPDVWDEEKLPPHLRMRFVVLDGKGNVVHSGRTLPSNISVQLPQTVSTDIHATDWVFGDLPSQIEAGKAGWKVVNIPALSTNDDGTVGLKLFADSASAAVSHEKGLLTLFQIALGKEWKQLCIPPKFDQAAKRHLRSLEMDTNKTGEEIARGALRDAFLADLPAISTEAEFRKRTLEGRARVWRCAQERGRLCNALLFAAETISRRLASPDISVQCVEDVSEQLAWLLFPGFAETLTLARLRECPRYLDACRIRLERASSNPDGDTRKAAQVLPFWRRYVDFFSQEKTPRHNPAELAEYRWLVEEFRVNQFAQELRTPVPVSPKRLEAQWAKTLAK